jgi:hypothetical protein
MVSIVLNLVQCVIWIDVLPGVMSDVFRAGKLTPTFYEQSVPHVIPGAVEG